MADTTTLHYGLVKPEIDASKTTWGDKLNADLDTIDNTMFSIASAASSTAVSAAPPATPSDGMMWWESDTGYLFLRYNDGNSAQWVQLNGIPTALQANYVAKAGDTMTGALLLAADPVVPLGASTKQYADTKLPLMGVTDGSNALAGQVGEVIAVNIVSPGVTLTSATTTNITNISLTPGDWDVSGEVYMQTGTTAPTAIVAAIGPTSAVFPNSNLNGSRAQFMGTLAVNGLQIMALRSCRVNLAATTTYYLLAQANFAGGTTTAWGSIIARRAR